MFRALCLALLILSSCAVSDYHDFQKEGIAITQRIVALLIQVDSKEDMQHAAPKLKKQIEALTELMIEAKKYQLQYKGDPLEPIISIELSDQLTAELERIYAIHGVEEIMHSLQRHSLHRLDAFHRQALVPKRR